MNNVFLDSALLRKTPSAICCCSLYVLPWRRASSSRCVDNSLLISSSMSLHATPNKVLSESARIYCVVAVSVITSTSRVTLDRDICIKGHYFVQLVSTMRYLLSPPPYGWDFSLLLLLVIVLTSLLALIWFLIIPDHTIVCGDGSRRRTVVCLLSAFTVFLFGSTCWLLSSKSLKLIMKRRVCVFASYLRIAYCCCCSCCLCVSLLFVCYGGHCIIVFDRVRSVCVCGLLLKKWRTTTRPTATTVSWQVVLIGMLIVPAAFGFRSKAL